MSENGNRWDFVPLPPDTYEKPILWSRTPEVVDCAHPKCNERVEGPLCDKHFREVVERVQLAIMRDGRLAEKAARTSERAAYALAS